MVNVCWWVADVSWYILDGLHNDKTLKLRESEQAWLTDFWADYEQWRDREDLREMTFNELMVYTAGNLRTPPPRLRPFIVGLGLPFEERNPAHSPVAVAVTQLSIIFSQLEILDPASLSSVAEWARDHLSLLEEVGIGGGYFVLAGPEVTTITLDLKPGKPLEVEATIETRAAARFASETSEEETDDD